MRARTHYDVLGVGLSASAEEIRVAYRRRARITHPDLGGDPAEFHAVQVAFDILGNPRRRAAYDGTLPTPSGTTSGGTHTTSGGTHVGNATAAQAGRPMPGGQSSAGGGSGPWPGSGLDPFEPMEPVARASLSTAGVTFRPPLFPPEPPRRRLGRNTPPPAATDFLPMPVLRERIFGEPGGPDLATISARRARAAERRTEVAIREGVMPAHPAMRLVHGLRVPGEVDIAVSHVIVMGLRVVLVSSVMVDAEEVTWDGTRLAAPGAGLEPGIEIRPDVAPALPLVRPLLLPTERRGGGEDVAVSGLVVVHAASGRLGEPRVKETRGASSEWIPAVNVAGLLRYLQGAARSELQIQVVDARLLSRILALYPGPLPH